MTALARFDGAEIGWPGRPVLRDLRFELQAGERVALLGRSGSGKSTLVEAIRRQIEARQLRLALVPQDHGLVPQLSVQLNVWMGVLDDHSTLANLWNLIRPTRRARAAVAPWLETVGLQGLGPQPVETLSGGQRQRTAVARALLRGGLVVLADEPVSAVDQEQSAALVRALNGRFPTVVMALHDTDLALAHATRIVGLRAGGIAFDRPATEVGPADLAALYAR
ncbi:ATP-binding cassette domain-containing protein [Rhodobacter sp. CZR27]|uniref:ATP-binding cassette domain-containing protein n=1 Tax=Rhodobacter sp. CZR27 TaxID=2033869 RepID=UPI000BBEEC1A|nr:ATP-binding cassette domain-containing protein [Rhodobacter sp. CZR27]